MFELNKFKTHFIIRGNLLGTVSWKPKSYSWCQSYTTFLDIIYATISTFCKDFIRGYADSVVNYMDKSFVSLATTRVTFCWLPLYWLSWRRWNNHNIKSPWQYLHLTNCKHSILTEQTYQELCPEKPKSTPPPPRFPFLYYLNRLCR